MSEVIGRVRPKGDGAYYRGVGICVTDRSERIGDTAVTRIPPEVVMVTNAGAERRANVQRPAPLWARIFGALIGALI